MALCGIISRLGFTDSQRLEQKRIEHERTRTAQRAKFEEQMRKLEADQQAELAEDHQQQHHADGHGPNGNATSNGDGETTSAPTTPPGPGRHALGSTTSVPEVSVTKETPAPIGQGRELANGAKSMPASRRTSGYGTFGMEKLSLSVMEGGERKGTRWEDEEVDAEGAQSELVVTSHDSPSVDLR